MFGNAWRTAVDASKPIVGQATPHNPFGVIGPRAEQRAFGNLQPQTRLQSGGVGHAVEGGQLIG